MVIQIRNNAFTGRNNRYRHCQCARHPDSWPTKTSGGGRSCSFRALVGPKALSSPMTLKPSRSLLRSGSFSSFYHWSGILARPAEKYFPSGRPRWFCSGQCDRLGHLRSLSWSRSLPPRSHRLWVRLCSLSSTALVLRTLGERGELDAPHGRFIVGTLIFQDLCIVPMVLIVPFFHRDSQSRQPGRPSESL